MYTQELIDALKLANEYLTRAVKEEHFVGTASEIRRLLVDIRAVIAKAGSKK